MLLSVITIGRNNAQGLSRTLNSVLGQTDSDFEYIIVDGASTDNSVELIRQAEKKRPIKWISEPDSGIYNAMNKGARMATGDYMLFLNSGDSFASETVVADIKKEKQADDFVIGRINFVDAQGREHRDYQRVSERHSLYGFRMSLIPHQATLIKRSSFFTYGPYEEKYKIVADWQYCLKAIYSYGCTYSTIPVTIANFDNGGISSSHGEAMMAEIDKAFRDTLPQCVADDYIWAEKHRVDLKRIEWLSRHKVVKTIVNGFITLCRKVCR